MYWVLCFCEFEETQKCGRNKIVVSSVPERIRIVAQSRLSPYLRLREWKELRIMRVEFLQDVSTC